MISIIHGNAPGPTSWTAIWLWIGCGLMGLGLLAVLAIGARLRHEDHSHVVPAAFVQAIATAAYFALATGQLDFKVGGQNSHYIVEVPRYIDWLLTTPLLLLSLVFIALASNRHLVQARSRTGIVAALLGAQALVIVTGFCAALQSDTTLRVVWFCVSCVFQVGAFYLAWVTLRRRSAEYGGDGHRLYVRMLSMLTGLWVLYPVVWGLGDTGFALFGLAPEDGILMALDVTAKAVFNVILLGSILRLSRRTESVPGHDTIDILAASTPEDEALDRQALTMAVHMEPALSGGVRLDQARGNGHATPRA